MDSFKAIEKNNRNNNESYFIGKSLVIILFGIFFLGLMNIFKFFLLKIKI